MKSLTNCFLTSKEFIENYAYERFLITINLLLLFVNNKIPLLIIKNENFNILASCLVVRYIIYINPLNGNLKTYKVTVK